MEKIYNQIPILDLNDFKSNDKNIKQNFVNELGQAYENIGFVAIRNHNLSEDLQDNLYKESKKFFYSEDSLKEQYNKVELAGQRGYIPKNKEIAKGASQVDMKEFYQLGQESIQENIFPVEFPGFKNSTIETFKTLEDTGKQMLSAIALHLGLNETHFDEMANDGNSILRLLHYYPIEDTSMIKEGSVRAAEHGDINLITLLMGASADGLEVLRNDGEWIPVTVVEDAIVVNIGDMMERYTNGKLKSTIHRVVNPTDTKKLKESRFSVPFFFHPKLGTDLSCLECCIDDEHPKQFEDIDSTTFLNERLAEIGLK